MHNLLSQNNIAITVRRNVRDILRRAQDRNQAGVRTMRDRNQTVDGRPFTGLDKVAVWLNAVPVEGRDGRLWRQDACGAVMRWADYGNTQSPYGWEVDHITPVALGGTDDLSNLQALHWQNNHHKADTVGENYCVVPAV